MISDSYRIVLKKAFLSITRNTLTNGSEVIHTQQNSTSKSHSRHCKKSSGRSAYKQERKKNVLPTLKKSTNKFVCKTLF